MNTIEISVTGPVGTGKKAILSMIEQELRRQGFAFRYAEPAKDIPDGSDVFAETLGCLSRDGHTFVLRGTTASPGATPLEREPLGVAYTPGKGWEKVAWSGGMLPPTERSLLFSRIESRRVDGQDVVAIPAFHYRIEQNGPSGFRLWLSPEPREGFTRHPAFMLDGEPMDEILIGAYEASSDSGAASAKGTMPMVNVTLAEMKDACAARGEGWGLWSIYELAAIQMLALVDHATADLQDAVGRGNVSGRGAVESGSTSATWRGLHELWGNVFHWVDGLRVSAIGDVEVWDLEGRQEWVNTEVRSPLVEECGWPTSFHAEPELEAILLPSALTGEREDAMLRDFHFGAWEGVTSYPIHGGHWSSGSYAGLFYLYLSYAPSNSHTHVGGRLAKRVRSSAG